jgi:coenzyme F420-reducing hydrogenase delta subunit
MSEDNFKFSKDNPGALINSNLEALEDYKIKRKNMLLKSNSINEVDTIKEDVNLLKNELSDIKSLLLKVLEKNG